MAPRKRKTPPAPDMAQATALEAWPTREEDAIPGLGEIGLNQFAPYLMNRISARWNASLGEALREFELSTTQMRALAVLSVTSGLTINELSVFAVTEQSTMSRTLDALEEQGWIRRRMKPGDARQREVFLTDAGLELFNRVWPAMYGMYAQMFRGVEEMEFRGFLATLHKVLRNVRTLEA